ncbi:MAG TPA: hypothetical protein VGG33_02265, partial [Polyangia bacterium]
MKATTSTTALALVLLVGIGCGGGEGGTPSAGDAASDTTAALPDAGAPDMALDQAAPKPDT